MKEIYESACRTIVWLGDERPGSTEVAIAFLRDCVKVDDQANVIDVVGADQKLKEGIDDPRCELAWRELVTHIFRAPWWKRMWVIQEVAVAKEIVMLCGRHAFSWKLLERAALVAQFYGGGNGLPAI